jgi:hypothetical protein
MLLCALSVTDSVSFLKRTKVKRSVLNIIYNTTVNSEVREVAGLQRALCFRNFIQFHGTQVNLTSCTTVSKVRPSLPRFSRKLKVTQ